MREPARRFIAPNGRTVTQPLRDLPVVADEPEVRDRIREATSLFHEPECPSKATVDAQRDLARTYEKARYLQETGEARQARTLLTIEARMADVQRRAKLRHINISGEIHVARSMIERARAGGRKEPDAAVLRIQAIETRLDYRADLEEAA